MAVEFQAKYRTARCDGWKNVSKDSVITGQRRVQGLFLSTYHDDHQCLLLGIQPYIINAHAVTADKKNAVNLLSLVLADIDHILALGLRLVGYCTDFGGDAASMRRLLKRELLWIIVLDCWGSPDAYIFVSRGVF